MNLIARLAALVAAFAIVFSAAPAHADDSSPVVIAADLNVLANTCFPEIVRIGGLHQDDASKYYLIETRGPSGNFISGGSLSWPASAQQDVVLGWCSTDLPAGRYTVFVDGVERGGFNAYRPVLAVAVPPVQDRTVTGVLTIRGEALAGRTVLVTKTVRGKTSTVARTTDAAGRATFKCKRNRSCRVSFTYPDLGISTGVTKVKRR